jgi:tryptophanyl-tRNA synthetase
MIDNKRRLCGIRPTGEMHIGHYFSVIKPVLDLDSDVLIAEYHAPRHTLVEQQHTDDMLRRFNIPDANIRHQYEMFDPEFYFQLLSIARVGELSRMTQYTTAGDDNDAHLLCYPVLMTMDVAGYDEILVGEDQAQHINYARDLIQRYNRIFDAAIDLPEAKTVGGRVMSLTEPTKKMSKSEPEGCLFLSDSEDYIRRKIKAATMTMEGRDNLIDLYRKLGGREEIPEMNSDFKPLVADLLVKVTAPGRPMTHGLGL